MKWVLQKISPHNFHYSMLWGLDIWEFIINSIIRFCRMTEIHVEGGGTQLYCISTASVFFCILFIFLYQSYDLLLILMTDFSYLSPCIACLFWARVSGTDVWFGHMSVKLDRLQMTIWRMRIACWIIKVTDTLSQYVMLIAFPLQQCCMKAP